MLVAAVAAAGLRVVPVPGASSPVAAVSAAGDVLAQGFAFVGFLPTKGGDSRQALQTLAAERGCQVLFAAPHRIVALADALALALQQTVPALSPATSACAAAPIGRGSTSAAW